jgi:serine/threonine protein kinase
MHAYTVEYTPQAADRLLVFEKGAGGGGQVCRGVEAMHHMDPPLAHRDLKPQNVLLQRLDPSSRRSIPALPKIPLPPLPPSLPSIVGSNANEQQLEMQFHLLCKKNEIFPGSVFSLFFPPGLWSDGKAWLLRGDASSRGSLSAAAPCACPLLLCPVSPVPSCWWE